MAVTNWNLTYIDGKPFLVIDVAKFRVPLDWDPSSNMFIAVAAPDGGLGQFPALVKGDPGDSVTLDTNVDVTPLEYDDVTPDFASFTEIAPGVFKLSQSQRYGPKGDPGDTILTPDDYGTAVAYWGLQVKADLSGFELVPPRIGGRYTPTTINAVPSGNPAFTKCEIGLPAVPFASRVRVEGQTVITGTGEDVDVHVLARLNNAASGNIIARGAGPSGTNSLGIPHVLSASPPAGSNAAYDTIPANTEATVFIRTERQTGSNTYTTTDTTSWFSAWVEPVPLG